MMNARVNLQDIIAEAHRLGFLLFGVSGLEQPVSYPSYQQWIAGKYHAGMEYLATDRALSIRQNPRLLMPEAKSILTLAFPYPVPFLAKLPPGRGRTASYSWGPDYHNLIPPRLLELARLLEKMAGRPCTIKVYTDTGPILERDLAQRSGLGWIGKNSCLINPSYGSFFFLAELFTDLEIQPTTPFTEQRCGSCTRCLDACPTGCIRSDHTIDASRCISYLTIENKNSISLKLRPLIGNWVFGCDICQMVCPWNRFANPERHAVEFHAPECHQFPNLGDELTLTPQEFNRKFKDSPVQRARRRGYLRNIAVACGNAPDPGYIKPLSDLLLNDPDSVIRSAAAWALSCQKSELARSVLNKANKSESDPQVQEEIHQGLGLPDI